MSKVNNRAINILDMEDYPDAFYYSKVNMFAENDP
jgi:hypothetical protein